MNNIKFVGALFMCAMICIGCGKPEDATTPAAATTQKVGVKLYQMADGSLIDADCANSVAAKGESQVNLKEVCPVHQAEASTSGTAENSLGRGCCPTNNWWNYYLNATYAYYYAVYDPHTIPATILGQATGLGYNVNHLYGLLGYSATSYNYNSFGYSDQSYAGFSYTANYQQGNQWWKYYYFH